jgi:hypothetical protein
MPDDTEAAALRARLEAIVKEAEEQAAASRPPASSLRSPRPPPWSRRLQLPVSACQRLGTKEGGKDIYRMAKSRGRKTRDIIQVKCIKDEIERLLTKDEDIKNRWREYFDKLFNEDSESSSIELDISSDDLNMQFVCRIQESEVKDALKRMKGGKAMGPDGIPIEVWRSLGDVAIVWLTNLFNLIF